MLADAVLPGRTGRKFRAVLVHTAAFLERAVDKALRSVLVLTYPTVDRLCLIEVLGSILANTSPWAVRNKQGVVTAPRDCGQDADVVGELEARITEGAFRGDAGGVLGHQTRLHADGV